MRRLSESILIDQDIEIIVDKINSDSVILAIIAPKTINIMREERAAMLNDPEDIDTTIDADESGPEWSERMVERRVDEVVLIGKDIKVVIFGIAGRQVSIGIKAGRHIKVFRKECLEPTEPSNYY